MPGHAAAAEAHVNGEIIQMVSSLTSVHREASEKASDGHLAVQMISSMVPNTVSELLLKN
jgi:hypothetical protein